MRNRTLSEQYRYETHERGLSHRDALQQMSFMFSEAELETLQEPTCSHCGLSPLHHLRGCEFADITPTPDRKLTIEVVYRSPNARYVIRMHDDCYSLEKDQKVIGEYAEFRSAFESLNTNEMAEIEF